jgi:16S rRNA (guanine966-N2)-methyltransferase
MRITGGRLRGRRLASIGGASIRPTSDKVREAVFSMVGQDLTGWVVLDLFAGTGSLGIEAISRGASSAVFVENARDALRVLRRNLDLCSVLESGAAVVLEWDIRAGIPWRHRVMKGPFDLVFLDPPYREPVRFGVLKDLAASPHLSGGARIVAESSKKETMPEEIGRLKMYDTRTYGDTRIALYKYEVTA